MPGPERVRTDLRRRVAQGTVINALFNIGLNGLNLVKGFVAAAFLTTTDYGVWGIVFIALGTLTWLKQIGIGDKYVQQSEGDQVVAFQKAFTLELMVTAAFTALALGLVPIIALATGESELIAPGALIALTFPAVFLQTPLWVFYRRMDFLRQRLLQSAEPVVGAAVTIGLAIAGAGYWSLVVGLLVGAWAAAIVAVVASPYPLALRFDRATFRGYRDFSWPLFVAGAASIALPQGTVFLGEHAVGLAGVGAIALAVTVSQFTRRVDDVITTTIYPAICAVRDRTDLLFESFVKSNRLALMWGVPFGLGLALFAEDIVDFGIGERWEPAVTLIQVFGLIAAADQLAFNWDAYFRARGETKPMAVVALLNAVVFGAVAVPLLYSDGLDGYAVGMAAVTLVSLIGRTFFISRLFPAFAVARHAARAIAPTLPPAAIVLALRAVEAGPREPWMAVAELAAYLTLTVAATLAIENRLLREVGGYLRGRSPAGAEV